MVPCKLLQHGHARDDDRLALMRTADMNRNLKPRGGDQRRSGPACECAPGHGVTILNQNGNVSSKLKNSRTDSRWPSICTSPPPTA
jgi:hypothetical protein